jgi:hypothetical protein
MNGRYDRNIRFFGKEGQDSLGKTSVTIVGVGGVGGHVAQQLALLGPASIALVDAEELEDTNRNRYVTAAAADPVPGTPKVDIGERLIKAINPAIRVITVQDSVVSDRAFEAIIGSDYVFGCLDSEGARLVLTELCAAYKRPYLDTATDIETSDKLRYGGRVCVAMLGAACLVCLGQLDANEANAELGGAGGPQIARRHLRSESGSAGQIRPLSRLDKRSRRVPRRDRVHAQRHRCKAALLTGYLSRRFGFGSGVTGRATARLLLLQGSLGEGCRGRRSEIHPRRHRCVPALGSPVNGRPVDEVWY